MEHGGKRPWLDECSCGCWGTSPLLGSTATHSSSDPSIVCTHFLVSTSNIAAIITIIFLWWIMNNLIICCNAKKDFSIWISELTSHRSNKAPLKNPYYSPYFLPSLDFWPQLFAFRGSPSIHPRRPCAVQFLRRPCALQFLGFFADTTFPLCASPVTGR